MLDPTDFDLDRTSAPEAPASSFTRPVPSHWCYLERAFGGYTGAVALAAVLAHTGRDVLTSASVVFLAPVRPGPVAVRVETLRAGRAATVAHAVVAQHDTPVLHVTAWLADAWHGSPTTPAPLGLPGALPAPPADCPPLDWLLEAWPMLFFGERRAVDYPPSFATFVRGTPSAQLWLRIPARAGAALHPQLGDVLHLDAHLFDAPGMITGFLDPEDDTTSVSMVSLDLAIAWQPGAARWPSERWRLLDVRGSVAAGGVSAVGSLVSEEGMLLATASSQGLVRAYG